MKPITPGAVCALILFSICVIVAGAGHVFAQAPSQLPVAKKATTNINAPDITRRLHAGDTNEASTQSKHAARNLAGGGSYPAARMFMIANNSPWDTFAVDIPMPIANSATMKVQIESLNYAGEYNVTSESYIFDYPSKSGFSLYTRFGSHVGSLWQVTILTQIDGKWYENTFSNHTLDMITIDSFRVYGGRSLMISGTWDTTGFYNGAELFVNGVWVPRNDSDNYAIWRWSAATPGIITLPDINRLRKFGALTDEMTEIWNVAFKQANAEGVKLYRR